MSQWPANLLDTIASFGACRFCGCTEERACVGGCSWAFDDVCTACLGHTPASWAALQAVNMEAADAEIQSPFVHMMAAMSFGSQALDDIASHLAQHAFSKDADPIGDALENLLLAAIELIEAGGNPAEQMQLLGAIEKYREDAR